MFERSQEAWHEAWRRFLKNSSFLRHYLWKYRKYAAVGLLSLVIVDILEVLPPIFLKRAVDVAVERGPLRELAVVAGAYFVVALIQAIGRYGWRMYLIRASLLSGRDLRGKFAHHLYGLSASFFDKRPVGDLMSLNTSDVEAVRMMLGSGLLTLADALFYFVTVPIAMFYLSPQLALLAFVPLPIIPWLVMRNQREIHARYERVQESFSRISAMSQESLNGIRVIKGFAREDAAAGRFGREGARFSALSLELAKVQSAFGPTLDFMMSLGMVLLLFVGGKLLIDDPGGALSLGTFVAFQRYIQKMVWPMAALGMALSSYQRSVTSANRLKEVLGASTDVPEDLAHAAPRGQGMEGRIEFRDLTFRFPGSSPGEAGAALSGITLTIEAGERVAFVGAVGAGKTALLSLVPRLYPVAPGMLLIDGVDINRWSIDELRRHVGYVSQDVFLFSETVLENVAYGLSSRELTSIEAGPRDSIEEAAALACVHEDVLGLHESYRTRVGERGVNLSGGQKQRLTIARAIVKKPAILLLDDALAAVDVQTEERILRGLRARPGRNTEIIAAHRISTVRDADRIVVLERGRVTQLGTHSQLVAQKGGIYARFYDQQRLKADLESYSERLGATL